ncbi:MAG: Si-specific NAD(P)(+) transhydrogenase [Balneolaceae bacterium]
MAFDYDVIILGSGPAGFSCAMQSSKFDKRVLLVEANPDHLGGTWINTGTVPSKSLREATKLIMNFHRQFGDDRGRKPFERFRMEDLLRYNREILESKNQKVKDDIIKNEVDTVRGWGKLVDGHTVEVVTQFDQKTTYTAKRILISTGSSPRKPERFEIDHTNVLDYESILKLTHIPRRLAIVGSGIIALEYATIFASLGTRVVILSEEEEILPFLDEEIHAELIKIVKKKNIGLHRAVQVESVEENKLRTCIDVAFRNQSGDTRLQVIETEHVLYACGNRPNTEGIGLENADVKRDERGYIDVTDRYQTSAKNIYAAGDVIGHPSQASVSFVQGRLAACTMFDMPSDDQSSTIPYSIYSIPEIAGIGLTEKEAQEQGIEATVGRAYYKNITQADLNHLEDGVLKLVFRTDNLKLLGIHIIGDHAADLIHLGQSVMMLKGDIQYFIKHVLSYPSFGEAYRIAAFNGVNRVYKAGVKYKKILNRS